jgi:hypothetical protein
LLTGANFTHFDGQPHDPSENCAQKEFLMKGFVRRRSVRRGAIIALVAAVELVYAGFVIGVAASAGLGLDSSVTVSIDGAAGTWAPTQSSAVAPSATGTTAEAPAASPDPPSGQSIVSNTPSVLETTPSTSAPAGTATGAASTT